MEWERPLGVADGMLDGHHPLGVVDGMLEGRHLKGIFHSDIS